MVTHAVQCCTVTDSTPQPGVPPFIADHTQQKNWETGAMGTVIVPCDISVCLFLLAQERQSVCIG